MSKKDEALNLALEALKRVRTQDMELVQLSMIALAAIREALAEQPAQQQEPYGQVTVVRRPGCVDQHWFYRWPEPPYLDNAAECHTVYTSPPASKPWVGLTDEEYREAEKVVWAVVSLDDTEKEANREFYEAIEAKLREKNA